MNEDELIKSVLGDFTAIHNIRMPQVMYRIFRHHEIDMSKVIRMMLVQYAIELDPENKKLKKLKKLLKS